MQSDLLALTAINTRWLRLHRVIEERAADRSMWQQPGGRTGLLVRSLIVLGSDPSSRVVEEFSVDYELLAEMRALEEIAAHLTANTGKIMCRFGYSPRTAPDVADGGPLLGKCCISLNAS